MVLAIVSLAVGAVTESSSVATLPSTTSSYLSKTIGNLAKAAALKSLGPQWSELCQLTLASVVCAANVKPGRKLQTSIEQGERHADPIVNQTQQVFTCLTHFTELVDLPAKKDDCAHDVVKLCIPLLLRCARVCTHLRVCAPNVH